MLATTGFSLYHPNMPDRTDARKNLDRRFEALRPLSDQGRPHKGWIRAIRDALGMSSRELANRLGVSQQTVAEFEANELRGTIRLDSLKRVADALDCDLTYYLIPRQDLEEMVRERALKKARRHLSRVSHHSRLEDQQLDEAREEDQLEDFAERFIDRRGLWSDDEVAG